MIVVSVNKIVFYSEMFFIKLFFILNTYYYDFGSALYNFTLIYDFVFSAM